MLFPEESYPPQVLCDSIIRLIPGVMNNETSALFDSFQDNLLAPLFTQDLLTGKEIKFQKYYYLEMRRKLQMERTKVNNFD